MGLSSTLRCGQDSEKYFLSTANPSFIGRVAIDKKQA